MKFLSNDYDKLTTSKTDEGACEGENPKSRRSMANFDYDKD